MFIWLIVKETTLCNRSIEDHSAFTTVYYSFPVDNISSLRSEHYIINFQKLISYLIHTKYGNISKILKLYGSGS